MKTEEIKLIESTLEDKTRYGLNLMSTNYVVNKISQSDFFLIEAVLARKLDLELKCAVFFKMHDKSPKTMQDIMWNFSKQMECEVEMIIDTYRKIYEDMQDYMLKPLKQRKVDQIKKELHAPTDSGTIAEICEKYNLSKSQVRKMKADGTLAEFLNSKD